jgi:hypothetical protein
MPADYCEFVNIYGAGTVSDSFSIVWPLLPPRPGDHMDDLAGNTEVGRWLQDGGPEEQERVGGWIAWAYDVSANRLYWDTSADDSGRWSVVRLDRGGDWADSGLCTTEYLAAFLGGDLPEPFAMTLCPSSSSTSTGSAPDLGATDGLVGRNCRRVGAMR